MQWSDEDGAYIVSVPKWGDAMHPHGDTYVAALARETDLREGLSVVRAQAGEPLP